MCGIFATLCNFFDPVTVPGGFSAPMSRTYNSEPFGIRTSAPEKLA
jgi:hypothetical protein